MRRAVRGDRPRRRGARRGDLRRDVRDRPAAGLQPLRAEHVAELERGGRRSSATSGSCSSASRSPTAAARTSHIESFRAHAAARAPARPSTCAIELLWAAFAVSLMVSSYRVAQVAQLQDSPGPRDPDELAVLRHGGRRRLPAVRGRAPPRRRAPSRPEKRGVMIWLMFALMLGTMLIGVPILLCIALVGFIGIAAEPGLVLPLFAQKMFAQLDSLHAARAALLHPRRRADVGRRHEPAAGRFRARAGRPPARRPRARVDRRQHGVRGHLRLVHRGRLGDRRDRHPDDEALGLQGGLRRGADRLPPAPSARSSRRA